MQRQAVVARPRWVVREGFIVQSVVCILVDFSEIGIGCINKSRASNRGRGSHLIVLMEAGGLYSRIYGIQTTMGVKKNKTLNS